MDLVNKVEIDDKALPQEFPHQLHVYTGDNKGKTTAAIGLCIRALGAGFRVVLLQFDKGYSGDDEHYCERNILRGLTGMRLLPTGLERMTPGGRFRFGVTEGDLEEARRAIKMSREIIVEEDADLVVLDEILSAITYHLIQESDVIGLIDLWQDKRPFDLVLTGRKASKAIIDRADLVTEMAKIKHYFDAGIPARRGFDY